MISLREGLQLSTGGVVCFVGAGGKTSLMFRLARELSAGGDSVLTTTTTRIRMPTQDQSEAVVISPLAEAIISRANRFRNKNFHFTAVAEKLSPQEKLKGFLPGFIDELWKSGLFRWILVEADGAAGRSLKAPAIYEPVVPSCAEWVIGLVGLDAVGKTLDEDCVFRSGMFSQLTGLALGQAVSPMAIAASLTHAGGIFKESPGAAHQYLFLNKAESAEGIRAGREVVKIIKETTPVRIKRVLIGSAMKHPPVMAFYEIR
ncbi:MAG: selenium cofactor biosynthesis protein YqeC [Desulfobacterales bacterium]|nr:selenium cofactor biosynthesis protein YqeC [Desulfobacterales bacterium]